MYGGRGTLPTVAGSNIRSKSRITTPSLRPTTVAGSGPAVDSKTNARPGIACRDGRKSTSQRVSVNGLTSRTSTLPPVSGRDPKRRAAMTRVSFTTSRSPRWRRDGKSEKRWWSIVRAERRSTMRRAESRGSAGCWAINPGGRSKLKSAVRIRSSIASSEAGVYGDSTSGGAGWHLRTALRRRTMYANA